MAGLQLLNSDKLPKREFESLKPPDAPWCTCCCMESFNLLHYPRFYVISHMCPRMWKTLFPAVSEAGQKTFPKCKEGAERHRALTRMGSYKKCSQSGVPFCEAWLLLCAIWHRVFHLGIRHCLKDNTVQ